MYIKIFKKVDIYTLSAFIIVFLATALRVALAILRWPTAEADESIIQLMALHINNLGEHPVFFYGQHYMGTIEAYVGAAWFRLFGASLLTIRFAMISFFIVFLLGLYILTSRLYSRKFALLTLALFIFGTSKMIELQLATIGGYTEILPLAIFLLLVSYFLAVPEQPNTNLREPVGTGSAQGTIPTASVRKPVGDTTGGQGQALSLRMRIPLLFASWYTAVVRKVERKAGQARREGSVRPFRGWFKTSVNRCKQRLFLYTLWGLLAGLALWSDLLIAPYLLIAGILITLFCWQEIIKWGIWFILLGFCIGAFPLISHNLTAAPGNDSWSTFVALNNMGIVGQDNLWHHVSNTLLVSIPIMAGLQLNQIVTTWPSSTPHASFHRILQMGWSTGYLLLLCLSLWHGLRALRTAHISRASRRSYVQVTLHLLLVFAALLSIVFYVKGGATNIDALNGARYLLIIWISTPAVLWPLWHGIIHVHTNLRGTVGTGSAQGTIPTAPVRKRVGGEHLVLTTWRLGIIFMIFLVFLVSTLDIFSGVASAQRARQATVLLTQKLEEMHITRFFSEYWTCSPLIFASQEKLICANTDPILRHGYDRYGPYRDAVIHAKNPAFVYPVGSSHLTDLEHVLNTTHTQYNSTSYEGYIIIQPAHPIPGVPLYQP